MPLDESTAPMRPEPDEEQRPTNVAGLDVTRLAQIVARVQADLKYVADQLQEASEGRPLRDEDYPNLFAKRGGVWKIRYTEGLRIEAGEMPVGLDGLEYIHAIMASGRRGEKSVLLCGDYDPKELEEEKQRESQAFEMVDDAKRYYRGARRDIFVAGNDDTRWRAIKKEIGARSHLVEITNIYGKPKVDPSTPSERARQRVKNAKRRAVVKLREHEFSLLAAHLEASIRQDWRIWRYDPEQNPRFRLE